MDYVATLRVDQNRFLTRITDLVIAEVAGRPVLISATYLGGGLASFAITDADLPASAGGLWSYPIGFEHWGDPCLQLLEFGGQPWLTLTGLGNGPNTRLPLLAGGDLGPVAALVGATPLPRDLTQLGQIEIGGDSYVYAARQGDVEFTLYREADDGSLTRVTRSLMPLAATMPDASLDKIIALQMGGQPVLVAISGLGNFLSSHRLDPQGGIIRADYLTSGDGTGFNVPNDVAAVTVDGLVYLIMTSARSSSITTVRLLPDGSMIPVDHVVDELSTRFQRASALATVEVDGRAYVFVGGMDDGLSVFTLQPDGKLLHLETLIDDAAMTLADVSAIAAEEVGGKIVLFVSSSRETGITQLSLDPGQLGLTRRAGAGIVSGGSGNDLLSAGRGTAQLKGGDGDDVLIAGREDISIWGGAGHDIFVASPVAGRILIRDFEPGEDLLDLSQLGMVRSIGQLTLTPFSKGIRIRIGETLIEIHSARGTTLAADLFTNAMFPVAHYTPPDVETIIVGSTGSDRLIAARGGSEIHGLAGADLIVGSEVEDLLIGDDGNDTISAGASQDTVQGGAGDDRLRGGEGADQISGDAGNDVVIADAGNDLLDAGEGGDTLFGGTGKDSLLGGSGHDFLSGDDGDDDLQGGSGNDSLSGGAGNDRIDAGDGDNILAGDAGDDALTAGGGVDRLRGGAGADVIRSGGGNDVIEAGEGEDRANGEAGDDRILAEAGNDTAEGGSGNDTLHGGLGDDLLQGDDGDDLIFAGGGDDLLFGGNGGDSLIGGSGASRLEGGEGNDLLVGDRLAETLLGGGGDDTAFGHGGSDRIEGGAGRDLLFGGGDDDGVWGEAGPDMIFGDAGDDQLYGGEGQDNLRGGDGNDLLEGGAGADNLLGGAGMDRFVFRTALDSTIALPDRIEDFASGSDLIDLTALHLQFIGAQAFSAAGQMRLTMAVDHQLLQADLDGDGQPDLVIRIDGTLPITGDDLLL
ncbi:calcium-binding protein [uncultured Paracoccus sp.]|uniref:calcium-binding protein n=1 Tax=uncultured Paracoccus sp. TaxID=189685 RepID=UPI00261B1A12|nr:calcium-binding protein [uncultured Paracoccus sp.]